MEQSSDEVANFAEVTKGLNDEQRDLVREFIDSNGALENFSSRMSELGDEALGNEEKLKKLKDTFKAFATDLAITAAITAVTWAINKGIEAFDNYIHRFDIWREEAANAKSEYDQEADKVEQLNKTLNETVTARNEAYNTTSVSQEELNNLDSAIEKLEAELKLEKEIKKEKAATANSSAYAAAFGKQYTSRYNFSNQMQTDADGNTYNMVVQDTITPTQYLQEQIQRYGELDQALTKLSADYNDGNITQQEFITQQGDLTREMESVKGEIIDTYQVIDNNFNNAIDDGSSKFNALSEDFATATTAWNGFSDQYLESANSMQNATGGLAEQVGYTALTLEQLNTSIDSIQSAYKDLTSAVDEYNAHGYLSLDTLQSLLALDDQYIGALVNENGQLSVNMASMQALAEARLNDAKATAIQQAMAELDAIANNTENTAAAGAMSALTAKGAVVDYLAGCYANLGDWAGYAYNQQALADSYSKAAIVDPVKAGKVMTGLNTKLGLIDATINSVRASTKGVSNALGGFSSAAGGAANGADKLTDSLNKQKEALQGVQDELEKEQNRLKIYGQAATKAIEDQIDALNEKKKALQDANDEEDRAIKLAELQEALARAQSSRTQRVYKDGEGFTWQADQSAVDEAQNKLDDQQRDWTREDAISAIDAEIDKLNELKDQYSDTMGLIGTSWEDYQLMLAAAAEFDGMTYEQMSSYHTGYKDTVLQNMQELFNVQQQILEIDKQIEEAQNALSESTGEGGGGGGGLAGNVDTLRQKYQDLAAQIALIGIANDELREKEAELKAKVEDTSYSIGARRDAQQQLTDVQRQIADNDQNLIDLSAQYVESLANETEMTDAERQAQMDTLDTLLEKYNISYDGIAEKLQEYLDNLDAATLTNDEKFGLITSTIELFQQNMGTHMENAGISIDNLTTKVEGDVQRQITAYENLIRKLEEVARKAQDVSETVGAKANYAGTPRFYASGTVRAYASGSPSVNAIVDDAGREIVVRPNRGRYTTLEVGDGVVKNDWTNTLMSAALNPNKMISDRVKDYFAKNRFSVSSGKVGQSISVNVGGITMNEVNDLDTFSRVIERNIGTVMAQALGKRS